MLAQLMAACPAHPLPVTTVPLVPAVPRGDRPWERALLGPEGTVAWPGPHIIAVINAVIRTINNSSAILLTSGCRGQEIPQSPVGAQQSRCQPACPAPAGAPGPSPARPSPHPHPTKLAAGPGVKAQLLSSEVGLRGLGQGPLGLTDGWSPLSGGQGDQLVQAVSRARSPSSLTAGWGPAPGRRPHRLASGPSPGLCLAVG